MGDVAARWILSHPPPERGECSCDYMGGMCGPCMDWHRDLHGVEELERRPTADLREAYFDLGVRL